MDKELVKLAFKLGYQKGCQDLEKVAFSLNPFKVGTGLVKRLLFRGAKSGAGRRIVYESGEAARAAAENQARIAEELGKLRTTLMVGAPTVAGGTTVVNAATNLAANSNNRKDNP